MSSITNTASTPSKGITIVEDIRPDAMSEKYIAQWGDGQMENNGLKRNTMSAYRWLKDCQTTSQPTQREKDQLTQWLKAEPPQVDIHAIVAKDPQDKEYTLFEIACLQDHDWAMEAMLAVGGKINDSLFTYMRHYDAYHSMAKAMELRVVVPSSPNGEILHHLCAADRMDLLQHWVEHDMLLDDSEEMQKHFGDMLVGAVEHSNNDFECLDILLGNNNRSASNVMADYVRKHPQTAAHAMLTAAWHGHVGALDRLLDLGVDPEISADGTNRPLWEALGNFKPEAYWRLRHAGSRVIMPSEIHGELTALQRLRTMLIVLSRSEDSPFKGSDIEAIRANKMQFRAIIRDALEHGCDPLEMMRSGMIQNTDSMTLLHAAYVENHSMLAPVLMEEGFSMIAEMESGLKPYQCTSQAGAYTDQYNEYKNSYEGYWARFSKGWNPFVAGEELPRETLSDHPLALMHAFSAIGKLRDALEPRYWLGEEGMAKRAEVMAQLYPYQQTQLGYDYIQAQLAEPAVAAKPFASWTAAVSSTPAEARARS